MIPTFDNPILRFGGNDVSVAVDMRDVSAVVIVPAHTGFNVELRSDRGVIIAGWEATRDDAEAFGDIAIRSMLEADGVGS